MRILLLSLWYSPEPVTKPHDLGRELVRLGHEVTAITSFPNYPQGQIYDSYRIQLKQWEWLEGVRVLRLPTVIDRSRSAMRRIMSYLSFTISASLLGAVLTGHPDVIWSYQIGLPGVILSKLLRAPLVHEVQDLWPEWSRGGGMGLGTLLYDLLNWQERTIYRNASVVTTITPGFKQALQQKGVPASKIMVLPNWANEQNFRSVQPDATLALREGLAGKFNVMYGGNIGTAQGLQVVLDAATLLQDLPDVQFVLIGDGVERERLAQEATDRGLAVRFLGSRPPDRMAEYLEFADALLIHLKDSPEYALTIPSKTYSYLAMGKPIIVAATGEAADLVQTIGCGLVCAPENPTSLAQAIRSLYVMPDDHRTQMGQRGQQAFLANYTPRVVARKYEALFENVVATNGN